MTGHIYVAVPSLGDTGTKIEKLDDPVLNWTFGHWSDYVLIPFFSVISTSDLLAQGIMKDTEAQVKIARLSTALAQTLYQQVTGTAYTGNISASAHLVCIFH